MANPHRGAVTLQAGEEAYTLSFSINAICELEEALDMPVAQIAERLRDEANIRMSTVRLVIWASLLDHHKVGLSDAGEIATAAGIGPCMEAVGRAFSLAFPEARGNARPPKAAKGG